MLPSLMLPSAISVAVTATMTPISAFSRDWGSRSTVSRTASSMSGISFQTSRGVHIEAIGPGVPHAGVGPAQDAPAACDPAGSDEPHAGIALLPRLPHGRGREARPGGQKSFGIPRAARVADHHEIRPADHAGSRKPHGPAATEADRQARGDRGQHGVAAGTPEQDQ